MTATLQALLDAHAAFNRADEAHQHAVIQLAISAERWVEVRPDRLAPQLTQYRDTLRARSEAGQLVKAAERAAAQAGDLCGECGVLAGAPHVDGCELAVSRAA